MAQNTTCSLGVAFDERICTDVPAAGGINYASGVSKVIVNDEVAGQTTLNANTIGILLQQTGVDGSDNNPVQVANKILNDNNTPNDTDDDYYELADASNNLVQDNNGHNIRVVNNTLTDANGTPLTFENLSNYFDSLPDGGGGIASGDATVINNSSILSSGADGIIASSRGGKGGKGGVVNIIYLYSKGKSGGDGDDGGSVAVTNDGTIIVAGTNQYGIYAFSKGGAGGDGGGVGALVAKAGSGGDGGDGNSVQVDLFSSSSSIITTGNGGHGVFAESLGGDGGRGGNTGGAVALGSKGGDGGEGSAVTVNNNGFIDTSGNFAYGIFGRSYGAGAGSGSSAGGIVAIGGNGGGFANGGSVDLSNFGTVKTLGIGSYGIIAQSVGGGGGDGGDTGGLISIGGSAGSGGNGDKVFLQNSIAGTVSTQGYGATAILAQSIGGGGGNGGSSVSAGPGIAVAVGGSGGPGGDGSTVTVDVHGTVSTLGGNANAIHAQSIGGGGGNGGLAISGSISTGFSAAVAVGGSGEEGGAGGIIDLTSNAVISTQGDRSSGIVAQSIGGGGGNGGAAVAVSLGAGGSVSVGVAGSGDGGGNASRVDVDVQWGSVTTQGNSAYGIFAQSVGGGGGSGGLAVSASLGSGGSAAIGIGGAGAKGGTGQATTVVNAADLQTGGEGAYGIFAQSIGGGGGEGGMSVAAALSTGASLGVSIGGAGGSGNTGGTVKVTNSGEIVTTGNQAYGALAQSVGGGGGAGGSAISVAASGGLVAGSLSFAVGGSGGTGGTANRVDLDNTGNVNTSGDGSSALLAQSVGGGGGAGGYAVAAALSFSKDGGAAIGVGLGGAGGGGGTGGIVDLTNTQTLMTTGGDATAIIAQSIGGGGGVGGMSIAAALNFSGGSGGSVAVSLGGKGGVGGVANIVTVDNDGAITTLGDDSRGILAQSIGGAGGSGGISGAGSLNASSSAGGSVAVALGGKGGDGGTADTVTVDNDGVISTSGARASGIVGQSIGGEGGAGGFSVGLSIAASQSSSGSVAVSLGGDGNAGGTSSTVTINNNANITTDGQDAYGVIAQSIGGSGGIGGFGGAAAINVGGKNTAAIGVAVGGVGGTGGIAGAVNINNVADIATTGVGSYGLLAQSIGGGGGAGGGAAALSFAFTTSGKGGSASVAVGREGGSGGESGIVAVEHDGVISTTGENAYGILAQSIGGAGGSGGLAISATGAVTRGVGGAVGVAVGGAGGTGGEADAVVVGSNASPLSGSIWTTGENAAGIVAQSIGGGGGAGGFAGSLTGVVNTQKDKRTIAIGVTVGGFGGSGGESGTVDVNTGSDFDIHTTGDFAYGIHAQSVGGKGGTGGGALGAVFNVATDGNSSLNAAVTVGGFGGDGAVANVVTVNNAGMIITGDPNEAHDGQFAHGILAQSIGGDGGAGGFSGSIVFAVGASNQSSNNYNLALSVGGFGGTGADADEVIVDNSGTIVVYGERARGIFAQSVGGGGGAGGDTGLGDDVWGENFILDTAVSKIISGNFSELDLGAGGAYAGGYGANSHSLAASVGGFGGAGGDGAGVDVDNTGTIITFGTKGHAIFAQSVGGGGGQGGLSTAATAAAAASNSTSISLTVGGFGGAAGDGGNVDVNNEGEILTVYHGAYGIFGQSVGGGGGAGGDTRGFTLQRKDTTLDKKTLKPGKQLTVTVGGFGGAGGDSGTVDIENSGAIHTFGTSSIGIFAQTVGGGGGTGGNSSVSSKELAALFENDKTVKKRFRSQKYKLALGGFGGAGGHAEQVTVNNTGDIVTEGEQATAIYAQAVGGGGGTAGKASTGFSGDLSIGGFGGGDSDGGTVVVSNSGLIMTSDNLADGIFAQSVGGGGGDGGAADFGDARSARGELIKAVRKNGFKQGIKEFAKKIFMPTFGIGVGGFGGASGDGGDVTVCNGATYDATSNSCSGSVSSATISTTGNASHGIFAQTVGGGGGSGGQAYLTNMGKIGIGGLGGAVGDGGNVNVVNNGNIITQGNGSYGVFAQSVGGGGGLAGDITFGITNFGRDEAKLVRNLAQYKDSSDVESIDIDGDGTISSSEVTETQEMYGFGSGGETNTDIDQNGLPISDELAAQFAALYDAGKDNTIVTDPLSYSPADPLNGQSTSSVGSLITSALSSALSDAADEMQKKILGGIRDAFGNDTALNSLFDSLSGSEFVEFLQAAFTTDGTSFTFKSSTIDLLNGITGDGGEVSVTTSGDIIVTGGMSSDTDERAGSIGIFAQSVGGGGGIVGNTVEITEAEIDTDLNLDGDKDDTFDVSDGSAFAGTVGGKGKGGKVSVTHTGSISAATWNGYGIFAQSTGGDGGDDITINVSGGSIHGGENQGAAILLDGGDNNRITIGSDSIIYAMNNRAIIASDSVDINGNATVTGNETINNSGLVIGIVDVGVGTNAFFNQNGGEFRTNTYINLGDNSNVLTNMSGGLINPYGMGMASTTNMTGGSFTQDVGGIYFVDATFDPANDGSASDFGDTDLINAAGTVDLQGGVVPNLMTLASDDAQLILTSGAGPVLVNGVSGDTVTTETDNPVYGSLDVRDTLVVDYGLRFNDPNYSGNGNVLLTINSVDFSLSGFTPNQTSTGNHFNDIIMKSSIGANADLGEVLADLANLQVGDVQVLGDALDTFHSEPYLGQMMGTLFSDITFMSQMTECTGYDARSNILKSNCVWGQITTRLLDKRSTSENFSSNEETQEIAVGVQFPVAHNFTGGFAVKYVGGDMVINERMNSEDFENVKVGTFVNYRSGQLRLSAGGNFGYSWYNNERFIRYPKTDAVDGLLGSREYVDRTATGESAILSLGAQLRAAYRQDLGPLYVQPFADLRLNYMRFDDFYETGAGGLNLELAGSDNTLLSATLGFEIGSDIYLEQGAVIRPYVSLAARITDDPTLRIGTYFEGSPKDISPFEITSPLDQVVGVVDAGLDIKDEQTGFAMKFAYKGRFSTHVEEHAGTIKLSVKY